MPKSRMTRLTRIWRRPDRHAPLALYLPVTFGNPDFIFAAAISKRSARPYETVQPLAQRIDAQINAAIADDDYQKLADHLLSHTPYIGKFIVVCWHHGHIPDLMRALGAADGTFPDPWDSAVFDLILKVEFNGGVAVTTIKEPF